jgi:hypothetical protein
MRGFIDNLLNSDQALPPVSQIKMALAQRVVLNETANQPTSRERPCPV